MDEEIKDITPDVQEDTPLEVTIKKEKEPPTPSFDYDDYDPSDSEIMEIEKEIKERIEKRTKPSGT